MSIMEEAERILRWRIVDGRVIYKALPETERATPLLAQCYSALCYAIMENKRLRT